MLKTPVLSRRAAFAALSVPAVNALASAARAAPLADSSALRDVCFLTPQSIEGPYYLDPRLVRRQIAEGTLAPGMPTPSITTLSQQYGHARQTCAKALRTLEDEGLLVRIPGLGYYVKGTAGTRAPA